MCHPFTPNKTITVLETHMLQKKKRKSNNKTPTKFASSLQLHIPTAARKKTRAPQRRTKTDPQRRTSTTHLHPLFFSIFSALFIYFFLSLPHIILLLLLFPPSLSLPPYPPPPPPPSPRNDAATTTTRLAASSPPAAAARVRTGGGPLLAGRRGPQAFAAAAVVWLRLRLVFSLSRCFLFLVSVGFGRNSDWAFVCGGGCRGSRILGFFFWV